MKTRYDIQREAFIEAMGMVFVPIILLFMGIFIIITIKNYFHSNELDPNVDRFVSMPVTGTVKKCLLDNDSIYTCSTEKDSIWILIDDINGPNLQDTWSEHFPLPENPMERCMGYIYDKEKKTKIDFKEFSLEQREKIFNHIKKYKLQ